MAEDAVPEASPDNPGPERSESVVPDEVLADEFDWDMQFEQRHWDLAVAAFIHTFHGTDFEYQNEQDLNRKMDTIIYTTRNFTERFSAISCSIDPDTGEPLRIESEESQDPER